MLLVVLCLDKADSAGISATFSLTVYARSIFDATACIDNSFSTSISPNSAAAKLDVMHSAGTPFFLFANVSSTELCKNKLARRSLISASFFSSSCALASL